MADMTREEIRAYCESGENCLTCQFSECIYDGAAYADRDRQLAVDKDIVAGDKTTRQLRTAAYNRAYREANRERIAEQRRAYHREHREERAAKYREYCKGNIEKLSSRQQILFLCRKKAGMPQEELARRLGVSQKTISVWERGLSPCRWDLLETVFPGITERSVS